MARAGAGDVCDHGVMRCRVSAVVPGEERHWVEVEAASLYTAIFAYNHEVVSGLGDNRNESFRGKKGLEYEVITYDGRTFRTTWDAAMRWANRPRR